MTTHLKCTVNETLTAKEMYVQNPSKQQVRPNKLDRADCHGSDVLTVGQVVCNLSADKI